MLLRLFETILIVSWCAIGAIHTIHNRKSHSRYMHYDALVVARCEARCWRSNDDKSSCMRACISKGDSKPGFCPDKNSTLSPFATVCLNTCKFDTQCPQLSKCCRHSCGITCQQPQQLLSAIGVPQVPRNVKITEGRRKRTIYIEWTPGDYLLDEDENTVIYLIEERHQTGRYFQEKRFTDWSACSRTDKIVQILRNFAKPGRWYQFRVAAVNANGTKGFSEHSTTFILSATPKPPKAPQNVTVSPVWISNDVLKAELRWTAPVSDLPLQRYRVFWSRRLHGAKALDSVLVHQQVVPKEQTHFLLQHLQPNSLYFLQVQALVDFGKMRLKGEKSGLILNTTNISNETFLSPMGSENKSRIRDLHLQKLFWTVGDLRARIVWKPNKNVLRYTVNWWMGACQSRRNAEDNFKLVATTTVPHFDLYNLQFNCRYKVSVREVMIDQVKFLYDTSITFTTPTCNEFKMNHKKIRCTEI